MELGKRLLLLGLPNAILNLTTVPTQDNVFISWATTPPTVGYVGLCAVSNGQTPLVGIHGDFIPLCSFLEQQKGTLLSKIKEEQG